MNWLQTFDSFGFYYNCVIHENVQPVTAIQLHVAVKHGHGLLLFDLQASLHQLERQACFIG